MVYAERVGETSPEVSQGLQVKQVLPRHELSITPHQGPNNPREIQPRKIPKVETVSFRELFREAFACTPGEGRRPGGFRAYQKLFEIVGHHNGESPAEAQIRLIKKRKGRKNNYRVPSSEYRILVNLAKGHAEELEPYLPFYVTQEEWLRLKEGEEKIKGEVSQRLFRMGGTTGAPGSFSAEKKREIIKGVIESPKTWEVLLKSPPPFSERGEFQKWFRNVLYRKSNAEYGKQQTAERRRQREETPFPMLQEGQLRQFFLANPPGSELAEKLLATLDQGHRHIFRLYYLEGKSKTEVSCLTKHAAGTVRDRLRLAKVRLEQTIDKLPESRIPAKEDIVTKLRREQPDFYSTFLANAPRRLRSYAQLRFEEGLTLREVGQRMGVTRQAVYQGKEKFKRILAMAARARGLLAEPVVE